MKNTHAPSQRYLIAAATYGTLFVHAVSASAQAPAPGATPPPAHGPEAHRGPPHGPEGHPHHFQQAVAACAQLRAGATCTMTMHHGETRGGTCVTLPAGHAPQSSSPVLACRPNPPQVSIDACHARTVGAECSVPFPPRGAVDRGRGSNDARPEDSTQPASVAGTCVAEPVLHCRPNFAALGFAHRGGHCHGRHGRGEHGDREHDEREHGDREHGDREHGDREHGDRRGNPQRGGGI